MSKDDQFRQYAGGGASGRSIQNRKALATATRAHARACGEHYSKQNRTRLKRNGAEISCPQPLGSYDAGSNSIMCN